jgi:hypothetical protein
MWLDGDTIIVDSWRVRLKGVDVPTPSFRELMREQGGDPGYGAMEVFRNIIIAMLITIVLWAVIISGAWWVGITVSAKNELTPQQRIDEALKRGLVD